MSTVADDGAEWLAKLMTTRKPLNENEAKRLCERARSIISEEHNIQCLSTPVTVVGDLHGQYDDFRKLLQLVGIPGACAPPHNVKLVFLGDFVDRGSQSVETILTLLALKVCFPDRVTLIRGNHESREITKIYGFYDECLRKYGNANVWNYCSNVFDVLSLGALIDGGVLCVHGGLSPSIVCLDQIQGLDRKKDVPQHGPMVDLLWSDPCDQDGWTVSPRGAGFLFGEDVVQQFNRVNALSKIVRAHQLVNEGYQKMFHDTLVTVWSAPNYCHRCDNLAALMTLHPEGYSTFKTFRSGSNPVWKSSHGRRAWRFEYFD